jgi:outer membrane protein OmpA-like peptidoglycan-associated protein
MSIKIIMLSTACLALSACASSHSPVNQGSYDWRVCPNTGKTHIVNLPPCEPRHDMAVVQPVQHTEMVQTTTTEQRKLLPVFHTYTLYFNLNKSTIRPSERSKLDQVAAEINQYKPTQVTVTGFTDTSGTRVYNKKLSAKRAVNVSEALRKLGVTNSTLDEQARGEDDLAVPTANHVKEQANRRVVIDFRK